MVITEKLSVPYEQCSIRALLYFRCDYCGKEFQRNKKSRNKLNKIIDKDSCGDSLCTKQKKEESFLINHGSKNIFNSESFKQSQKEKNLELYGSEHYVSSQEFKEKRKLSLLKKYGAESPLQSDEIKKKQKETCIEKYGVDNYAKTKEFASQRELTNLEKYGFKHPMNNAEIIEKRNKTCNEKYGVDNYAKTTKCKNEKKETCIEKYGVDHTSKIPENRNKARQTNFKRYSKDNYAKTEIFRERFIATCLEKYGVPNPLCLKKNQIYGKTQKSIQDWLNSMNFNFQNDFTILTEKEIDLYDKNSNVAIEYCGLFWHNELSPQPRMKFYHYDKYKKCLEKSVRLITIFEDEWKNKNEQCKGFLQSILGKNSIKIHARKCQVEEIDKKEFNILCDMYHIQGRNNRGLIFFALKYQNEIVGGMSLGMHHRKQNELILDRLYFKTNCQVTGGASRLFDKCKNWAKNKGYNRIVSWSDNRWSQGNVYEKLNFKLNKDLPPDYSYVDSKRPHKRLSKQSQKKKNTHCPENMTEKDWSLENGLARIWDCGKKQWIFNLSES